MPQISPQIVPQIIPMKELSKNIAAISKMARETNKPIFVTRNGYADLVIQSVASYEEDRIESEIAGAVISSIENRKNGAPTYDIDEVFMQMDKKYGIKRI